MRRFGSWLVRAFGSMALGAALIAASAGESFAQAQQAAPEFSYRRTEVETGRALPEACIVFTAPLLQGDANRYRDFVRMSEGRQPALRVDGSRLCLSGLAFGRQYEIQLRAGLPAGDGRRLPENETVNVELRDRDPLIAFGDGFILARESAEGVPINTVNVQRVQVTIYRVPDRGLAQFQRGRGGRGEVTAWEVSSIASLNAAQVWQGMMDVAGGIRNETVTTLFPIQSALRERRPGLYLLAAVDAAQLRDRTARRAGDDDDWYNLFESGRMAAQWVIETDIGLSTFRASDGLTVFARSLNTARPMEGVEVALIARSNDELARVRTDRDGRAHFAAGLLRGSGGAAPQLVQAFGAAGDFSYQDLNRPAFDLSDRGVDGRSSAGPVDAFLYTERGIYRPRETVHVTALLRDRIANAIAGTPLTLWVNRPDGVEFRRVTLNQAQASAGVFYWPLTLSETAPRGRWEAVASVDGQTPVGRVEFQVQDFVPQKLRVQATSQQRSLRPDGDINVALQVDFLYGAPGADLAVEGEVRVTVDHNPYPQHDGYRFGLVSERFEDQTIQLSGANTNEQGRGAVTGKLEGVQANSLPLRAEITVAALEPGGRPVREQLSLPVRTQSTLLGIRQNFSGGRIEEDSEARFDVIAIDAEGNRVARRSVTWTLVREVTNYTWFQTDGRWRFQATTRDRPVADGTINVGTADPARVARTLGWGTYRLTVRDQEANTASSIRFFAGWGGVSEDDRPDRAEVAADKPAYRPGETARLRVRAPSAGQALVVIANDRVLAHRLVDVPQDGATIEIPVGDDWGAGAYAIVSSFRPAGDRQRRAPVRAIGVAWMGIDASDRTLNVAIEAPAQVLPRQRMDVTVRVTNATPGVRPTLTLAAVDEGILLLTRYQSPQPQNWYFGKRRLGVDVRDDYGRLIDATGVAGVIREGGDSLGGRGLDVVPIRIVSLFSGVVQVEADGTARIPIDVPDFNGQLRLMAVASDQGRIGSAEGRMIVRDPVVAEAVFPRFLAPGDRSTITTVLHNVDGQAGAYRMRVSAEGAVRITGGAVDREMRLNTNERQQALIGFEGAEVGIGTVTLAVSGPGNFAVERQWQIQVRPGAAPISEESVAILRPGDTLRLESGLLDNFVPGTGQVAITLSSVRGFDVPALLRALDRYPFGCLEQTTSRAFPLLVYDDLRLLGRGAQDRSIRVRVQSAIERVLDMQGDDGGFGMWYAGGDGDAWLSVFAIDFLAQAKQRGYDIPDRALRRSTLFLQRLIDETNENAAEGQAYAAWVLARSGAARPGDVRALYDARAQRLNDALSFAQLGGALLQVGDQARAREAFARAVDKIGQRPRKGTFGWYYGSTLRDLSGFIAVAAQAGETQLLTQLVGRLEAFDTTTRYSTTQEQAWMLLAAYAMSSNAGRINISVDGAAAGERRDPAHLTIGEAELARGSTIRNEGARDVFRSVAVQGIPRTPAPAIARGMSVRREFRTLGGELVDLERVRQNDRIVVVIDGRLDGIEGGEIAVLDLLPAGFEIEATLTPGEGGRGPYPWIGRLRNTRVQEARDDRYVAAIQFNDRLANRVYNEDDPNLQDELRRRFRVAYVVRAITPGAYVVPGANMEDMYRASIRARTAAGRVTIQPR
jgi:hypothetical protein